MIRDKPCKVLSISVSKTGKHGHAKCNFYVPNFHCTEVSLFIPEISTEISEMSDDDHDYEIDSSDSGASLTIPCDAGAIKKGG
eukprot:CAMPEP_0171322240 /NCGR_PEP_ID=MMETSP0816-20121228/114836_1 /TAXON_ID=420281 /ORGANISM="Proboscia inermis, Strain CCAP1064/1" /LENGTH=82 /DNA_ID=CAMNT_0011820667 /DNA_START=291 /DNA_END=539 /DNA_ORIENTATION=-